MENKFLKTFARYYLYAMSFGFAMFFIFEYLKKQEILAVVFVGFFYALIMTYLNSKQKNKKGQ